MTLAIAHRGDPRAFRENTLEAFAAAVGAGAGMVEIDVRLCADGGVAVLHDPTLDRLWGIPRLLAELTLDEARRIGIPSFDEVLEAVAAPLMVDYEEAEVAEPALEAVLRADGLERCLFSGGSVVGHTRIRDREPDARVALTWTRRARPPQELLDRLAPELFNPPHDRVDAAVVEEMHDRGLGVSTWTVDAGSEMERLLDLGVDAVITNRISLLVSLLAERAAC